MRSARCSPSWRRRLTAQTTKRCGPSCAPSVTSGGGGSTSSWRSTGWRPRTCAPTAPPRQARVLQCAVRLPVSCVARATQCARRGLVDAGNLPASSRERSVGNVGLAKPEPLAVVPSGSRTVRSWRVYRSCRRDTQTQRCGAVVRIAGSFSQPRSDDGIALVSLRTTRPTQASGRPSRPSAACEFAQRRA